jgi:hypothetical protein
MLSVQAREMEPRVADLEVRLEAAQATMGTDAAWRARDRVLSRDEAPAFMREVRAKAAALGAKVIALDQIEDPTAPGSPAPVAARGRLVAEGSFGALFELLRYLENRRVFVAVSRADVGPLVDQSRLKAVYQFEFLVVPAPVAGVTESQT